MKPTRILLAGLALAALWPSGESVAQARRNGQDDDEPPVQRKDDDSPLRSARVAEPPGVVSCLRQLGNDRRGAAKRLRKHDPQQVQARALESLQRATGGALLRGAALALADRRYQKELSAGQAQQVVRKRAGSKELKKPLRLVLIEIAGILGESMLVHLGDTDPAVVRAAALGLARCPSSTAVRDLIQAISRSLVSADEEAERAALEAESTGETKQQIGPAEARKRLLLGVLRRVARSDAGGVRLARVFGELRELPREELVSALTLIRSSRGRTELGRLVERWLETRKEPFRALAIRLLPLSRHPKARLFALEALVDEYAAVRVAGAQAAWRLSVQDAVPDLILLLRDEDPRARAAGHEALVKLTRQELPPRAGDWETWLEVKAKKEQVR